MRINRRTFSNSLIAGSGLSLFPQIAVSQEPGKEPHFFITMIWSGGLDASYLFDARPLDMTEKDIQVNHLEKTPILHKGSGGGSCWRTPLTNNLVPWLDRMTILNGVHMVHTFDGHPQNMNYLLTGNPFGGESLIPHFNPQMAPTPLDYVQVGNGGILANVTNNGGGSPLSSQSINVLKKKLGKEARLAPERRLNRFLAHRMGENAEGSGGFSNASKKMLTGFAGMPNLAKLMTQIELGELQEGQDETMTSSTKLLAQMFRTNVTRSGLVIPALDQGENLDTHDTTSAKAMPVMGQKVVDRIDECLKALSETPYDDSRSMLDMTTVMITSEFGRTMRQYGEVKESGTDHNPLTNSVLMIGKGIKGGQVIGQSDIRTVDEFKEKQVSGAHIEKDPSLIKAMGCPYDFKTGLVRKDQPKAYNINDYLTIGSIVNTLYQLGEVDPSHHRTLERSGGAAPIVEHLLT
jgi:hypothetical protein